MQGVARRAATWLEAMYEEPMRADAPYSELVYMLGSTQVERSSWPCAGSDPDM